jgi:hypothetical protein
MKAAKESAPAQDKQEAAAEEIKTEKTEKTAKKGNKGPDSVDVLTRVSAVSCEILVPFFLVFYAVICA